MSTFDVETINPKRNPAYNPYLYAFLAKSCFRSKSVSFYRVRGEPWVGTEDSTGRFIGGPVDAVVVSGAGVSTTSWPLRPGQHRDDALWAEYLRIGVCALFPEHRDGDYPQRWVTDGGKRTCQWCGRVEYLRQWEEVVKREAWEYSPDRTAGKCRAPWCYVAQVTARVSVDADKGLTIPLIEPWREPDCSGCEVCGGTGVAS